MNHAIRLILISACILLSACSAQNGNQETTALTAAIETHATSVLPAAIDPLETEELSDSIDTLDTAVLPDSIDTLETTDIQNNTAPQTASTINESSGMSDISSCVSHPQGLDICVDHSNRRFSATQSDGLEWWAFVLPGDNDSNAIISLLAVDDKVAIIADKTPNALPADNEFENERYETSLFNLNGEFIDTRHLLKIPTINSFVAICSIDSLDNCTPSLATHQFSHFEQWQYEHQLPIVNGFSRKAINANNVELLIDNLHDFWGTEHYQYAGDELKAFYEAVGDQLVVSHDVSDEDIPAFWIQNYTSNPDFYEFKFCPGGGYIVSYSHNPYATRFEQCKYDDWTINGEISSRSAHRTSDQQIKDFTITRTGFAHSMDGGYTFSFGGLFSSNSFSTELFSLTTTERNIEVKEHAFSSRSGNEISGSGMHGWRVVLADGRTGSYIDRGASYSVSSVSYRLTDSAFASVPISVSAVRSQSLTRQSILLSDGNYIPANQAITFELFTPADEGFTETRSFQNYVSPPYFTDGKAEFTAEDGSALVIQPFLNQHSPLAKVNIIDDESESPQLSTYMDYR